MPYDSRSYFEPGALTTEARTSGLNLAGGPDPSNQLLALMGPGLARKQALADRQQAMAEQEHAMRLKAMQQQMALERKSMRGPSGPVTRRGVYSSGNRGGMESGEEHSFVQNLKGGPQWFGGLMQAPAGMPGNVYGGYVPKGAQQLRGGGGSFQLSGGAAQSSFPPPAPIEDPNLAPRADYYGLNQYRR